MNKRDLKFVLSNLYSIALTQNDQLTNSKVIAVEAVKSIIGINLKVKSTNIFNWLESFINNTSKIICKGDYAIKHIPEIISYKNLEKSLLDKNLPSIYNNLYYLSRVSDGSQLLEYLLEFSLQYCKNSYKLIWSVYRMEMFLNKKFILLSTRICCNYIILDFYSKYKVDKNSINWPYVFSNKADINDLLIYYAIYNTGLIRSVKINGFISNRIYNMKLEKNHIIDNYSIKDTQIVQGRQWIMDFFESIDKSQITYEMVILCNNIRSCLKFSKRKDEALFFLEVFE